MKQRVAQKKTPTIDEAALEGQLSEAELAQVSGGVLASSPIFKKRPPPSTQWSGTPYQPEEDVEAY